MAMTDHIEAGGMSEVELERPFRDVPQEGAYCWHVLLPPELRPDGDDNDHGSRSEWRLWEDGVSIGQPHAAHRRIGNLGAGLFSHWVNGLYFSSSDNTDPNLNGRRYVLRRGESHLQTAAAAPANGFDRDEPVADVPPAAGQQAIPLPWSFMQPIGNSGRSIREFDLGDGSVQSFDLDQLPAVANSLDCLILRNREVSWEAVIPDFATRSTLVSSVPVLESFPSPGQAAIETAQPTVTYDGISFPTEGAYNVLTQFGVCRFLVLPETPSPKDVISIGRFFSANVIHSGTDVAACSYGRKIASTIYYPNLLAKLFRSDQPLGLICGQASMALCALYHTLGFEARQVHFALRGHFSTEVFDGERWVLIDPDFDCVVFNEAGELVDADVIARAILLGETSSLRVESLSEKRWLKRELGFLWGFYGQRTWRPEDAGEHRCSDSFLSQLTRSVVRRRHGIYQDGMLSMAWTSEAHVTKDEPNTGIPIYEQIERQRSLISGNREFLALYEHAISKLDIAANQELIYRYGATTGFDGPLKYLDCAYWLRQKLEIALRLDVHKMKPQRCLDIGTGGGHFPYLCGLFGHQVVGVDIDVPVYQSICQLLGVNRMSLRIERDQSLPDLGGRFQLITAFAAQFDYIRHDLFWSKDDWRAFLDDLLLNHMETPGRIYFSLNTYWDAVAEEWRFKDHVGEVFLEYGGTVDAERSVVEMLVTDELVQKIRSNRIGQS